ncbi:DUF4336 domain-containing protein [Shimia sp. FJ5]|uniref:DUF4336 domain-containing protein n=1 Tax=Shimia sp. FJ5 TaxID=3079054 RepID=UPI002619AA63|nr:DUF4336 domain-containing protein [Shimia sp. FJ5]MDV4145153.1 DUF4336 domain-containing protein [Shimia sp. FJ5]
MATGYEPLNTLKPIGKDIWIVDGPAIRFYGMPFSTRMTVVRLANGDLWLHSPVAYDAALARALEALGPIRHLIAPNWIHYAYVGAWQEVYPEAKAWAAPGVAERAEKHGVAMRVDHDLRGDAAEAPWRGEIKQRIIEGSKIHREAVFFHEASKTLILTDLIENFEPEKIPWWMRIAGRFGRIIAPDGQMPRDMQMSFMGHHDTLRAGIEEMIGWEPERIVIAHGAWFEGDAVAELRRAFRWVLR